MKRVINSAKEVSEGFEMAFDTLSDDISYVMDGIENLGRRDEAAAKTVMAELNAAVQAAISAVAENFA